MKNYCNYLISTDKCLINIKNFDNNDCNNLYIRTNNLNFTCGYERYKVYY